MGRRATRFSCGASIPASAAAGCGACPSSGERVTACPVADAAACQALFWSPMHPPVTCRRTQSYLDSLADEEDFMAADDMLLTVAETLDGSLLGEPAVVAER